MDTLEPAAKDLPVCPDEIRDRTASACLDARWPATEMQQRSSARQSGKVRWQELLAVYSTRDRVTILLLLGFSLLVRIAAWQLIFSGNRHAGEVWDAYGYFFRATGFEQMLLDLFQGRLPSDEARLIAYSSHWPPFQAGLLALGFLLFGSKIVVGQAMMVILSTLTTLLVYLITEKVSGRRAAIIAAMIHAIYPSFIHLSLRLLSETTYIFFSLLAIYLALRLVESARRRRAWLLAAFIGLLLGVSALTRAAALPWVGMLALWMGWQIRGTRLRLLLPAAMLAVTAVTVLPWEVALFKAEGRFVLLATSGEENLLRGNNPWIPAGFGSYGLLTMPQMLEATERYAEQHGLSDKEANRELALIEIRKDPAGFVERGFYKLRELWSVDSDIVLFILSMIYPPLRERLAAAILLATVASLPILQALAVWGLLAPKPALRARELFVALIAGTMVVIFVTIGEEPRFHVTLLAILLPAAGHGLAHLGTITARAARPYALAALLIAGLFSYSTITRLPVQYAMLAYTRPSSHYLPLIRQMDRWLGAPATPVSDRILFRLNGDANPGAVTISLRGPEYRFMGLESQRYQWQPTNDGSILNLVLYAADATGSAQIQLAAPTSQRTATLSLRDAPWQSWQPTGIPSVEYLWVGGSLFPDKSNLGRSLAKNEDDWDQLIIPAATDLSWSFKRFD